MSFFSHLSLHSTATMGIAMSLRDGSINLSNSWTRQLSETTSGNVCFSVTSDPLYLNGIPLLLDMISLINFEAVMERKWTPWNLNYLMMNSRRLWILCNQIIFNHTTTFSWFSEVWKIGYEKEKRFEVYIMQLSMVANILRIFSLFLFVFHFPFYRYNLFWVQSQL